MLRYQRLIRGHASGTEKILRYLTLSLSLSLSLSRSGTHTQKLGGQVNYRDFDKTLLRCKPSVSEDDLKEFQVLPLSRLIWARQDFFTNLYCRPRISNWK